MNNFLQVFSRWFPYIALNIKNLRERLTESWIESRHEFLMVQD